MNYSEASLMADIERIKQIPIISTILEVICKSTGMGFAAVARVTNERWIAGSVRDEIAFGLKEGGELPIGTTICNEIQCNHKAVVIDNVDEDKEFVDHHTPAIYGFKSYISVPVFLRNGDFFGTLCAIDPNPADLKNPRVIGMFNLFAELISFHLQSLHIVEESKKMVTDLNHQLVDSVHINQQYNFISNHNLQEPLRKIRVFSGMLVTASENNEVEKVREYAAKVDSFAEKFSVIINELSEFSEILTNSNFVPVDLNEIVADAIGKLSVPLTAANAKVAMENLPEVQADPLQMSQLFKSLISNSLRYAQQETEHVISIYRGEIGEEEKKQSGSEDAQWTKIIIADNGPGFSKSHLEKVFDVLASKPDLMERGMDGSSLAFCRKIVRNHGGTITVNSDPGKGAVFSITLPVSR